MDPLSVAASVVTVVGAAGTVLESLRRVRSFQRAPKEIQALIDEVSDLELVLGNVDIFLQERRQDDRSLVGALLGLSILVQQAKDKLLELDSIINCRLMKHACGRFGAEVTRFKWVWEKTGVTNIQRALKDVRLNLITALGTTAVFGLRDIRFHIEELRAGQHRVEDQVRCIVPNVRLTPDIACHLQGDSVQLLVRSPDDQHSASLGDVSISPLHYDEPTGLAISSLQPVALYRSACRCRCHTQRTWRSPEFLSTLVGFCSLRAGIGWICLTLSCDDRKCRQLSCHKAGLSTIQISYYFPARIVARMVQFKLDGPKLSLNFPRLVRPDAPIFTFALVGDDESIRDLFCQGLASPYDVDCDTGLSALHWAVHGFQHETCKMLVQAKADVALEDKRGISAIDKAWDRSYIGTLDVKGIFGSGCSDKDYLNTQRFTHIHHIVLGRWPMNHRHQKDCPSAARRLRQALELSTACINDVDSSNRTPLNWAVNRGDDEVVRTLLAFGADPNIASYLRNGPIHVAHTPMCFKLLISYGADVNARSLHGRTALHMMAWRGDSFGLWQLLISAGADINAQDDKGITALSLLVKFNRYEIARLLLQHGADPNTFDTLSNTPLLYSISRNHHRCLKLLLGSGVDCTFWTSETGTVLHTAASKGDVRTLEILTEAQLTGIDNEVRDRYNCTAFDLLHERTDLTDALERAYLALHKSVRDGNRRITSVEDNEMSESELQGLDFVDARESLTGNEI